MTSTVPFPLNTPVLQETVSLSVFLAPGKKYDDTSLLNVTLVSQVDLMLPTLEIVLTFWVPDLNGSAGV